MANEMTTTNSNTALTSGSYNPFTAAAEASGASSGLLFAKYNGSTNSYTFGKDAEEIPMGTKVAFNANESKRGWVCWSNGKVMEEIMVRVVEGPPPAKGSLTDYGPYDDEQDGWSEQSSIQFRDLESGDEFLLKTTSKSGRIAVANLLQAYGRAFTRYPGKLAVIELDNVSFDAKDAKGKKLGRKTAPLFKIVDWVDEDELIAKFAAQAAEDAPEAEDDDLPVNNAGRRGRKF